MAKRAIQRMRSERADVANLQTEAEAMKEEIQQLRARAQQETLEREHAAVGAATAEVSRLRDELDAVLAVGDAKLRSAERLCSKLRGDGDRKSAAIDTLELRIADADARRDAADADADVRGVDGPGPPRRAPEARRGVGRDDEPRSRARSSPREAEPRGIARDGASAASDPREAERADACGGRRAEERNATTPQRVRRTTGVPLDRWMHRSRRAATTRAALVSKRTRIP